MQQDALIVEQVRAGRTECYGELVARYERMVYGIAWSRLSDADLCDDVVQETFIQAYRYLGALRRPDRFAPWVARIARNQTAGVVRRRRRERESLRRWYREQPSFESAHGADHSAREQEHEDTLRQALEELPAQHRECLVLYYMEGLSQEECARRLGIRPGALRTRLHRARALLRADVESRLEQSLPKLTPAGDLPGRVMAVLPALPLWAKMFKFPGLGGLSVVLTALLQLSAYWTMAGWIDQVFDRPCSSEREFWKRVAGPGSLAKLVLCGALVAGAALAFGTDPMYLNTGLSMVMFLLGLGAQASLMLKFRPQARGFVAMNLLFVFSFAVSFFWDGLSPLGLISWALAAVSLGMLGTGRLNLQPQFAQTGDGQNLLERLVRDPQEGGSVPIFKLEPFEATAAQLRQFGSVLARHGLATVFSRTVASLWRRRCTYLIYLQGLSPPNATLQQSVRMLSGGLFGTRRPTTVTVNTQGTAQAQLGEGDKQALEAMLGRPVQAQLIEQQLAGRMQAALGLFCEGKTELALSLLGAAPEAGSPDSPPPAPRRLLWGQRVLYALLAVAALACVQYSLKMQQWSPGPGRPMSGEQAVARLTDWADSAAQPGSSGGEMILRSLKVDLFIPARLLPERQREEIRQIALRPLEEARGDTIKMLSEHYALLANALDSGLLTLADLAGVGLTGPALRAQLDQASPPVRAQILEPDAADLTSTSSVSNTCALKRFAQKLAVLKALGCLDLVDSDSIAAQIAARQCQPDPTRGKGRSETYCPGLFIFPSNDMSPFEPTCYALRILGLLGRLDAIDREACTQAFLSFYRGHGYFRIRKGDHLCVDGERSRYCALESLASLGALDRVGDLKYWKFFYDDGLETSHKQDDMRKAFQLLQIECCAFAQRVEQLHQTQP